MEIIPKDNVTLEEKLARPVFWGQLAGLTFQELQPPKFEESLELIKHYLIPEEVMCVGFKMEDDPEGCENLLQNARDCMRDGTSIVVLDEHEEEEGERVVGVMVARVVQRLEHMRSFSRIKISQGDAYQKWLALRCHLQKKADLFNEYGTDKYYRIYHIVLHPDYRRKGAADFLLRLATERLTRLFAGPSSVCTAVAPSEASQRLLARRGFQRYVVLPYHQWKDDSGRQLIENVGIGNYDVVLFVHKVGGQECDMEVDVSPLTNPEEELEREPEPPKRFPGRDLDRKPPPPTDCLPLPGLSEKEPEASHERNQSSYPLYPLTDMMELISLTCSEQ